MQRDCNCAVPEETVERYCLGHLESDELEHFEEHLLVCQGCQDRVAGADQYIRAMKQALGSVRAEQARSQPKRWNLFRWSPMLAAGTAAAALAVFVFNLPPQQTGVPQVVALRAVRGFEDPVTAAAKGAPLLLKADLTELPELPSYRIEIADFAGNTVWQGDGVPEKAVLNIAVPQKLSPGRYWVRVSGEGRLLREFGLKLE